MPSYYPFQQNYFERLLQKYPELLAFLAENKNQIEATQEGSLSEAPAQWMKDMYAAAEAVLPKAQADFKKNFKNSPLNALIQQADPDERSLELERTALSLMTIQAVAEDQYPFFEKDIKPSFAKPLTKDQFKALNKLLKQNFPNNPPPQRTHKLPELKIVLNALRKIRPLREGLGLGAVGPDGFLPALLKQSRSELAEKLPSLRIFKDEDFAQLQHMEAGFNYADFVQGALTERELTKLKEFIEKQGENALYQDALSQMFVLAGSAGHKDRMTLNCVLAPTYLDYALPALSKLAKQTPQEVYANYLIQKLQTVDVYKDGFSSKDRLLARLICLFRIDKAEKAQTLQANLEGLPQTDSLWKANKKFEKYSQLPELSAPTYMPLLLIELKNKQGDYLSAVRTGLELMNRSFERYAGLIKDQILPAQTGVNFNELAGLVKSDFEATWQLYEQKGEIVFKRTNKAAWPAARVEPDKLEHYAGCGTLNTECAASFFSTCERKPVTPPKLPKGIENIMKKGLSISPGSLTNQQPGYPPIAGSTPEINTPKPPQIK